MKETKEVSIEYWPTQEMIGYFFSKIIQDWYHNKPYVTSHEFVRKTFQLLGKIQ